MSLLSFSKKNKESHSLVFNITSGSVSAGLVKFTKKAGVNLAYYDKEEIPFQQNILVSNHIKLAEYTINNLAIKLKTEGLKIINSVSDKYIDIGRVFYFFSSPWSVSQTKVIKIKEKKPILINEKYLSKVINEYEHKYQIDIARSGKIIERKIIQIKIDDCVINDIYNKKATDVEVAVFFTVVPLEILDMVDEAVTKVFKIKNNWCHSQALATFSMVRNLFPKIEDFINIDISDELTDISVIKNNIIVSEASIPVGRNHFIRELCKTLKVSKHVADSMIKMHCSKNMNELASLKVGVVMDKVAADWLVKTQQILKNFNNEIYNSEPIFLMSSNDINSFIKVKLEKKDYEVIPLNNKKIKSPTSSGDTPFALELMFLDKIYII